MADLNLESVNAITFIDLTTPSRLDIQISTNLPTVQVYNPQSGVFAPDWSQTNLILTSTIYSEGLDITSDTHISIKWFKKIDTEEQSEITGATGNTLTISNNVLTGNQNSVAYTCKVSYIVDEETVASNSQVITFTKISQGENGVVFSVYQVGNFTKDNNTITLKAFGYDGATEIDTQNCLWFIDEVVRKGGKPDKDYSVYEGSDCQVNSSDIKGSQNYICVLTYKEAEYTAALVVSDYTDVCTVEIKTALDGATSDGVYYWVLYANIYSSAEKTYVEQVDKEFSVEKKYDNDYYYVDIGDISNPEIKYGKWIDVNTFEPGTLTTKFKYGWREGQAPQNFPAVIVTSEDFDTQKAEYQIQCGAYQNDNLIGISATFKLSLIQQLHKFKTDYENHISIGSEGIIITATEGVENTGFQSIFTAQSLEFQYNNKSVLSLAADTTTDEDNNSIITTPIAHVDKRIELGGKLKLVIENDGSISFEV